MAVKAIGMLSGGLDSTLATRIMVKLGFEVIALNFMSPFCTCTRTDHGCKNEAKRLADELGIPARVEFMGPEFLGIIKNPKFGYGKNMNPCIDCRVMTFSRAREIMEEEGAAFIFTGEVVGQRPMSQGNTDKMLLIEKEAGLKGRIVRPLCAQLMPPTIPELEGIINRDEMLAIHGRSRKEQIKLAKEEFGMEDNLCSSGGCLLTDPHFSQKVKDLVEHDTGAMGVKDARLLRMGRHFRINDEAKLVVGRDEVENERLERVGRDDEFIFYPTEINGPLALLKGKLSRTAAETAAGIVARYCSRKGAEAVTIGYRKKGDETLFTITVEPAGEEALAGMRV